MRLFLLIHSHPSVWQMALAPSAPITQRSARSNTPLVVLALLYGVVLLASWSPDTIHLMMPGSLEEGLKGGQMVLQFRG
jgi:hypothetical protein